MGPCHGSARRTSLRRPMEGASTIVLPMNNRQFLIAMVTAAAAAAAFAPRFAVPSADAAPRRYRFVRASDAKSKQHLPGRLTAPPTPENPPDFLGDDFDPDDFDQLSVTRGGRM